MIGALVLVVFPICMAYAAASDLVSMTIENRVSLVLVAGFLVVALLVGKTPGEIAAHFAVGLACLTVTFAMFAAGWMGGGDAKLIAATTLWFGPSLDLAAYGIMASLCGGGLTIGLLIARYHLVPATGIDFVDRLLETDTGVPYGIALGAAGLLAYTGGEWMRIALALAS